MYAVYNSNIKQKQQHAVGQTLDFCYRYTTTNKPAAHWIWDWIHQPPPLLRICHRKQSSSSSDTTNGGALLDLKRANDTERQRASVQMTNNENEKILIFQQ